MKIGPAQLLAASAALILPTATTVTTALSSSEAALPSKSGNNDGRGRSFVSPRSMPTSVQQGSSTASTTRGEFFCFDKSLSHCRMVYSRLNMTFLFTHSMELN
jgi:hypothetical protein